VLIGAALGGWLVSRLGIGRALAATGVAALASNLGYAAAALTPDAHAGIYVASAVESFCTGLAIAAFMSFLMRICDKEHAAVQYAVLTGLYALVGRGLGMASGVVAQEVGYAAFFAGTALLGLPGLALLPAATRWLRDR
jgi:PAT family beta-lactamase induction signal transducer AmpG